jgi:RNA-directed DNA polymerase
VSSPLLSNIYLNEVDRMLERAKAVTRYGKYTAVEYARFADDLVILIDAHPRHRWLLQAVDKRLREELTKLHVEVNEEKTRVVDLTKGARFGFLGFTFRCDPTRRGTWRPLFTPKLKKRTALLQELREIFRRLRSQPLARVVAKINPILRGWVQYFAMGNASRCFRYIREWVEKKVRRHLRRSMQRRGFGWRNWRQAWRVWLYRDVGLVDDYRVRLAPRGTGAPA